MNEAPAASHARPWALVAELGRGGMADVFLALPRGATGDAVVVKRIRADLGASPQHLAMFLDEIRIAQELEHPSIVRTLEAGTADGQPWLALEYVRGGSLDAFLRRGQDVRDLALVAIRDVLAGLHHAHERGVVHRDAGPRNVLVSVDGHARLADFGIAKAAHRATATTGAVVKGTVRWMAPEQALSLPVDRRADLFTAGIMLWEVVTGRPFWPNDIDDVTVAVRLAQGDYPRSPREAGADVDEAIDALCMQALARDPGERPVTAAAMAERLDAVLGDTEAKRAALGAAVQRLFGEELAARDAKLATARDRTRSPSEGRETNARNAPRSERDTEASREASGSPHIPRIAAVGAALAVLVGVAAVARVREADAPAARVDAATELTASTPNGSASSQRAERAADGAGPATSAATAANARMDSTNAPRSGVGPASTSGIGAQARADSTNARRNGAATRSATETDTTNVGPGTATPATPGPAAGAAESGAEAVPRAASPTPSPSAGPGLGRPRLERDPDPWAGPR